MKHQCLLPILDHLEPGGVPTLPGRQTIKEIMRDTALPLVHAAIAKVRQRCKNVMQSLCAQPSTVAQLLCNLVVVSVVYPLHIGVISSQIMAAP